ncbi:unnamed protein product [Prorocentrum cordatum]|uniref:Uncharacterized protein n=1 Tax=Prorocentrum cordatum TaxID=2364126 RepID=A0ABN9PCD5_9DINO|nr:unnamed protein product [Polarella glacialis]
MCSADADKDNEATPLHITAERGLSELVMHLCAAGAGKNKAKTSGATPVFTAAQQDHSEEMQHRCAAGADKDQAWQNGATPIFITAQHGDSGVVPRLVWDRV